MLSVRRRVVAAVLGGVLVGVFCAPAAEAGRVHPELEARLQALPAGGRLPVIVEMLVQTDPAAAAATAVPGPRHLRTRAVVDALRDHANQHQGPVRALLARERAQGNVTRVVPLWIFNGLAVTASEPVIRRLAARADVWEIRPDAVIPAPPVPQPAATPGPGATASVWNLEQIRAPEVWSLDPDYTGVGQVVGSFDTGVDGSHPDLQGSYRGNHAISWFDPYGEHPTPFDFNGHGTQTTGTAVGGAVSGASIGVAPGARWIAAKAWNDAGLGLASAFHAIFEWFLAPGGDPANAPDVVNSSWAFALGGCNGEFTADVLAFRAAGIFPSFAAGNNGPISGSVRSPGAGADAFAAGATDVNDEIASFSARGPSPCGGPIKPDLSAPGVAVFSTVPGGYVSASGTSMAAPHVSGAVAVLRSINPALTVDELEALLVLGAVDLGVPGPDAAYGNGRLDLLASAQILLGGLSRPTISISATNAVATEIGDTTGVFTLARDGATDDAVTVRYTVGGTATAGADYVALSGTVTFPAGSATATLVIAALDDTIPEGVETVIVTLSPDPAYVVGASSRATVMVVSDEAPPDLIVSALSAPATLGTLSPFTLTTTVKNQGALDAATTTLKFYLSTNGVLDAGDTLLGSRVIEPLAVGAESAGATGLSIPAGIVSGTYHLIARADADDVVVEGDETNNVRSVQLQVRLEVIVAPASIDLATPPATFTVTGNGFANVGFGLPVVNFVRGTTLLAQARATAVAGTTLTVPYPTAATTLTPNVPGLSVGPVEVQVWLQTSSGSFGSLGSGPLTVVDTRPAPGVTAITPSSIDLAAPPATFTLTGGGFANAGFGLPVINFMRGAALLAQARATALTGSTALTVPFPTPATSLTPNLPGLSAGTVQVQAWAATGSGAYSLIGSVTLTIVDTRSTPGVGTITPSAIDLATPPSTFTLTGGGFANVGFGLPVINFVRSGALLAQARASALTGSTALTVPFPTAATSLTPNLPGLSAGTVQVQVWLPTGPGAYSLVGTVTLAVTDTRPAPGVTGITPSVIDVATPPSTFTITGGGFENLGFGLPVINFARGGVLLAQARATAVTGGAALTVPFPTAATSLTPNLPGLSSGTVQVQVWSQTGPGSFRLLGSATLTVQ